VRGAGNTEGRGRRTLWAPRDVLLLSGAPSALVAMYTEEGASRHVWGRKSLLVNPGQLGSRRWDRLRGSGTSAASWEALMDPGVGEREDTGLVEELRNWCACVRAVGRTVCRDVPSALLVGAARQELCAAVKRRWVLFACAGRQGGWIPERERLDRSCFAFREQTVGVTGCTAGVKPRTNTAEPVPLGLERGGVTEQAGP